ncbi:glycerate kinase [Halobacillus litoralis]|uniref:glycerate kinase n=1 Tax=Halobacillus litoralis TaxID=45668 RepID=UPI001CD337EB|nr:glycerate kinase [Halobacillus litoralis]MCA0971376.1 glycerate kinase [Halobacillus litoralis]
MRVVFAPDSFKGSLSSIDVAAIMSEAFKSVDPKLTSIIKPMADGGEGTLESLITATSHKKVPINCTGPLGESLRSWYVELPNHAVIEGALIAGLPLVPEEKRNPDNTTSYGIGEAIRHALDQGHRKFIIAIGGSSSNDGGIGMLQALGMKAYDVNGNEVGPYGRDLHSIEHIDFSGLDKRLDEAKIQVACDVDNPLTGPRGASQVYGPQKGATDQQISRYDDSLSRYGSLVEEALGKSLMTQKGAGAAGGIGFAFLTLGASLESGAKLVAEAISLDEAIQYADLVLTGEGQSDEQTLYGKAPGYVAELAFKNQVPAILLSGSLDGPLQELNKRFNSCFSIVPGPKSLEDCMEHAEEYLYQAAQQIARLLFKKYRGVE